MLHAQHRVVGERTPVLVYRYVDGRKGLLRVLHCICNW